MRSTFPKFLRQIDLQIRFANVFKSKLHRTSCPVFKNDLVAFNAGYRAGKCLLPVDLRIRLYLGQTTRESREIAERIKLTFDARARNFEYVHQRYKILGVEYRL